MSDDYSNATTSDTLESLKTEREDLEETVDCARQMARDFDALTERRKSFDARRVAFHLQLKGPDLRRCIWKGFTTPEAFQWHKAAIARKKVLGEQVLKDTATFCQALVRWAEDLEKREQQHKTTLSPSPSVPIVTGGNGLMPDEFGESAPPESEFPVFVVSKLYDLARIMREKYGGLNNVAQLAVLKYIGEEYSGRGPWDVIQDWDAGTGHGGGDLGFRDPVTGLPAVGIPERWRTDKFFLRRGLTQVDFLDWDIGIANVNLRSAALLSGITTPNDLNALAKYLTTDIGTVDYANRFVKQAQDALSPLINGMDTETQAQLIVDLVREGPDKFWNRVKTKNGLNDEELNAWKQAPNAYRKPNGTIPIPPEPNPDHFIRTEYGQIKKALGW